MTYFFDKIVKKILAEGVDTMPERCPYGFWIDRSGNITTVPYQAHGAIALRIIAKNENYNDEFSQNVSKFTDYSASQIMANDYLLRKGFVKTWRDISGGANNLYYDSKTQPTHKQISILHTMAITYDMSLLRG